MRLTVLACLFSISWCAGQPAGKVTRTVEPANVQRGANTLPAAVDQPVQFNDTLKTGPDGRIRVVLKDGSILVATSNASLKVVSHNGDSGMTQLELKYGYVRATVVGAVAGAPTPQFEVRTNTAVCGVLGTQFEVEADDNATQAHVHEGTVHFTNAKTGEKMDLTQGQSAHLLKNGVMRQGLYPRFARQTRQRWAADRSEIQAERVERNQSRQKRAQAARQKAAAAKKGGGKKKPEKK